MTVNNEPILCATFGLGEVFVQFGKSDDMPIIVISKLAEPGELRKTITPEQRGTSEPLFGIRFANPTGLDFLIGALQQLKIESGWNDEAFG